MTRGSSRGAAGERGTLIEAAVAAALLTAFAALALWNAWTTSPTVDEPVHLAAGYSYLAWSDFRLCPEHPPLVRLVAAVPLLAMPLGLDGFDPEGVDTRAGVDSASRGVLRRDWAIALSGTGWWLFAHEFFFGVQDSLLQRAGVSQSSELPTRWTYSRGDYLRDAESMLRAARGAVLPFGIALGLLVFLWAREIHGFPGAVLALTLFCFDPSFIANSALVTTDVASALGIFGSVYALWRVTRRLSRGRAVALCVAVALAATAKFSTVLLVPIFILLCLFVALRKSEWPNCVAPDRSLDAPTRRLAALALLCAGAAIAAVVAIWGAYGFRFSATADPVRAAKQEARLAPQLGSIPFRSRGTLPFLWTLRRGAANRELLAAWPDGAPPQLRNEVARSVRLGRGDALLQEMHERKLLPEAFLAGLASLRLTMLRGAYLNGEYSASGFRSYFLWSFVLKTPLVTLLLLGAALLCYACGWIRLGEAGWFLAVPVVVYVIVALQSPINIGHRHLLPVYPFLYVAIGGLACRLESGATQWKHRAAALVPVLIALSAFVVVSPKTGIALVAPHHLSYFNELAGGPSEGARHLVDSNVDWGQDLPALRAWMSNNEVTEPINLCYFGSGDPRFYGIPFVNLEGGFGDAPQEPLSSALFPGYVAVSETSLRNVFLPPATRDRWARFLSTARPVGRAGYSIVIYRRDAPAAEQ
ncbi:MAG: phospholipid carrier-dependent glycosyltransferase [Thermoanaerobaculia bacterium]